MVGEWVVTRCVVLPFILRIAVTVKRCASANKPCMVGGWVPVGECCLVREWVAASVVLPPLKPSTTNIYLLNDVLQRTNLAWRANTMVQLNANNTNH